MYATMLCGVCVTKLPDDFGNGSMRIQGLLYVGTFPLFIRTFPLFIRNACSPWSGRYFMRYGGNLIYSLASRVPLESGWTLGLVFS